MSYCNTWLTSRPAALLCKLTAALESWPVSCASTYCLEILSPKSTLSLQPPHNQPRPPAHKIWKTRSPSRKHQSIYRFYMHSRAQAIKAKMIFWVIYVFFDGNLTNFSVLGEITAAVVEVSQTTVPGQSVHDPRCTDCVDERSLSGGCQWEENVGKQFFSRYPLILSPSKLRSINSYFHKFPVLFYGNISFTRLARGRNYVSAFMHLHT